MAHRIVAKHRIAKQFDGSGRSRTGLRRSAVKIETAVMENTQRLLILTLPQRVRKSMRAGPNSLCGDSPKALIWPSPISPRLSCPIICLQTVSRSHTICKSHQDLHPFGGEVTYLLALMDPQLLLGSRLVTVCHTFGVCSGESRYPGIQFAFCIRKPWIRALNLLVEVR